MVRALFWMTIEYTPTNTSPWIGYVLLGVYAIPSQNQWRTGHMSIWAMASEPVGWEKNGLAEQKFTFKTKKANF